jgi:Double zinc ribbon
MPDTCPKCSTALDEDAIFCPSCATPVTPRCPSCQKYVTANAKFCKYCAFDLSQTSSTVGTESSRTVAAKQTAPQERQFASGIEGLLADKYHSMSDSQLLAFLRGDLSGETERCLNIALAELETRTNIDWRDMGVAKTRVREAIIASNSHGSIGSYTTTTRYNAVENSAKDRAERLAKAGGITAGISALLFLWGYSYTSSFANSARAGLMSLAGQSDSTYQLASFCVFLGSIGFIVGLIFFIVGMAQRSS